MALPDFKIQSVNADGSDTPAPGALDDAAWDGTGDPASVIALLRGIYVQLAAINANTTA